jgi:hypothetical protein
MSQRSSSSFGHPDHAVNPPHLFQRIVHSGQRPPTRSQPSNEMSAHATGSATGRAVLEDSVGVRRGVLERDTPSKIQKASWTGERKNQSTGDPMMPFHNAHAAITAVNPVTIHAV